MAAISCQITAILFAVASCNTVEFSCKDVSCSEQEYCYMKAVECNSEPCPKIPNCLSSSNVCQGTMPYIDDSGGIHSCVDSASCASDYQCVSGYCCRNAVVDPDLEEVDVDKDNEIPFLPPIFSEDLYKTENDQNDKSTEKPCTPCDIDVCSWAICSNHIDAQCVQENCSCETRFEDSNGIRINDCKNDVGMPGQPPFGESDGTTPKPIVPPKSSEDPYLTTEVVTLETSNKGGEDSSWIYALCAIGGVVVLCLIAFAIYKVIDIRQRNEDQKVSSVEDAEHKIPLNKVSSENNNDLKSMKPLINGEGNAQRAMAEDV